MPDQNPDAPNSLSGMVSTFVPALVSAGILVVIFLVLRRSQRRWYAPRTYIGSLRESERTPAMPSGLFNWIGSFWKIPDVYTLKHQSLDAYLFLRFLRMTILICFVGCCITWPILFPINATGGGTKQQLDVLTYANVDPATQSSRYYAHVVVAWAFYSFVMYLIMRECIFYINVRSAFMLSPLYANRLSTKTVLFTSVPAPYLDPRKLAKVFGEKSVKNIWITGDTDDLDKLVEERDKVAMRLEKAEVKLIKAANKERNKAIKKDGADEKTRSTADTEAGNIAARWLPDKKRPTHRTGPLGLLGKKVDTITWCRSELERLIPAVDAAQASYRAGDYRKISAAFVEFNTQSEAQAAYQVLAHHLALHMSPRYIGITPREVVWKSLRISWWQKIVRRYAVIAFITALIIFWAIPVAVVGAISNINNLKEYTWLRWLDKIPSVIMGVITGLLPAVALSILMSLVPVVMRLCARLSGEPSTARVELFTQNAYFAFQIIQVFLVTTLSSAATSVGKKIAEDPGSATDLLAQNLPLASNVYISYFIVQGLTIASSVISQVAGFVIFNILYRFLSGTPRAMYNKWANLSAISWGSTLPIYTCITCIAITYSGIAPLMLGWATVGMSLFYLAWRYNVFFVTDTNVDTRGLIYPRALKQLFTGIYLSELSEIGLLGASAAPIPLVLMVVFLIFTVLFHLTLNSALDPLLYNLPQSLMAEEESVRAHLAGAGSSNDTTEAGKGSTSMDKNGAAKMDNGDYTNLTVKEGNFLVKFLKPWIYCDYATMRRLVPQPAEIDLDRLYSEEVEQNAYCPPSVNAAVPLLWIPEDRAGISKQEIAHTSRIIPITDEGCELDENNKLQWDRESTRPPVWEEKILY